MTPAKLREPCPAWISAVMVAVLGSLLAANLKETYNLGRQVAELRVEVREIHSGP